MSEEKSEALLLQEWLEGSIRSRDELITKLYPELLKIASANLRKYGSNVSLFATELIHETMARILAIDPKRIVDKSHMLRLASLACRHAIFDLAKSKSRQKRRGLHITYYDDRHSKKPERLDVDKLHKSLLRLEAINPELSDLVTMRFFGGLSINDIANELGIAPITVRRKWDAAKDWLEEAMLDDF